VVKVVIHANTHWVGVLRVCVFFEREG